MSPEVVLGPPYGVLDHVRASFFFRVCSGLLYLTKNMFTASMLPGIERDLGSKGFGNRKGGADQRGRRGGEEEQAKEGKVEQEEIYGNIWGQYLGVSEKRAGVGENQKSGDGRSN